MSTERTLPTEADQMEAYAARKAAFDRAFARWKDGGEQGPPPPHPVRPHTPGPVASPGARATPESQPYTPRELPEYITLPIAELEAAIRTMMNGYDADQERIAALESENAALRGARATPGDGAPPTLDELLSAFDAGYWMTTVAAERMTWLRAALPGLLSDRDRIDGLATLLPDINRISEDEYRVDDSYASTLREAIDKALSLHSGAALDDDQGETTK